MDNDRLAYEFSYALYLARQVDWEAGLIGVEQATEALRILPGLSVILSSPL